MFIQSPPNVRALASNASWIPTKPPTEELFGLAVSNSSVADMLDWLCARLDRGEPTRVAFLNAHCVNLAAADAKYQAALSSADVVLPDGSGIALAVRLKGLRLLANLNGTDLIPRLGARLAASGRSVFLVGGRPGVAANAAAVLAKTCPGLRIAGTHHGYFAPEEEDAVIEAINMSGADVVLAAFGVPRQDVWLEKVAPRLTATLSFGVGGLFDFLSGRIPRAPRALRAAGLEWTYRLYQEPARMWRRYILGNPEFVGRAVAGAFPWVGRACEKVDLTPKRGLDVVGSAVGLVLLAPLFLGVSIAIRVTSPGPALLRQTRIGQDGVPFTLFKFRSMYRDAEARRAELEKQNEHGADGVTFKLRRDPRITPIGRLLRRSSIDELPQLLNVLLGQMSLVGPRPPLPDEVARYRPEERRRLAGKPGLTCVWQVSGRADLPFARQVELDVDYLARRNIFRDLAILLRTVPAVLTARGAY